MTCAVTVCVVRYGYLSRSCPNMGRTGSRHVAPRRCVNIPGLADLSGVDVTNRNRVSRGRTLGRTPRIEDLREVSQQIPPVMYAFRLADDVIKIGWTTNLDARRRKLGASWDGLLAIKPGTIEDERRLHRRISDAHRHHAIEYYLPTPQIVAMLNGWRRDMGLPPLEVQRAA